MSESRIAGSNTPQCCCKMISKFQSATAKNTLPQVEVKYKYWVFVRSTTGRTIETVNFLHSVDL